MDRRDLLKGSVASVAAASTEETRAWRKATTFLLVHGSWHGAWCWSSVASNLISKGYGVLAIDLPGHGLKARFPAGYFQRPLDITVFENAPSPMAKIPLVEFTRCIVQSVRVAKHGGADRVIVAGHSMAGVPLSIAGEQIPDEIAGLIYVSACMVPPGKAYAEYFDVPSQADEKISQIFIGDAMRLRGLRWDPRSLDPSYRAQVKSALAADVDDDVLTAALNLLTPDAPFSMYFEPLGLTSERYGSISRCFVQCSEDFTVRPATQELMISDVDRAFPKNPTRMQTIASSHEVMLSQPAELANAFDNFARSL